MDTIGKDESVRYIRRVMGRPTYSNRDYEYAYVYAAVRAFQTRKQKKLLDVGSGFSSFTKILDCVSDCCASDIDTRVLTRQRKLGVKFRLCDATNLPFDTEYFDIVTSVSAIEHFGLYNDDKSQDVINADMVAMDEFNRVLKTNGQLIFTVPFTNAEFYIERGMFPSTPQRWYDRKHIKTLIAKFDIINITYGRYIVRPSSYEYCTLNDSPNHIMVTVKKK